MALRLIALGATVGALGRRTGPLDETRSLAGADAPAFLPLPADIRNDTGTEALERFAADGLDGLVNCAGGQFYADAADITRGGFAAVTDLNLTAFFVLCRAARRQLANRGGAIVTLSIVGAERGALGHAHGVAARSGVSGLVRALALEWGEARIRVNALAVGTVATPAFLAASSTQTRERLAACTPIPRLVKPEEVAELSAFLLSDAARMITGQTLRLDGGAFLAAPIDLRPRMQESRT